MSAHLTSAHLSSIHYQKSKSFIYTLICSELNNYQIKNNHLKFKLFRHLFRTVHPVARFKRAIKSIQTKTFQNSLALGFILLAP